MEGEPPHAGRSGLTIRACVPGDLAAVVPIYAHYVVSSTATFEEEPPTLAEWQERLAGVTALGLPFLVAELEGKIAGYAYATRWRTRSAYRHTVEDSVYVAPAAHRRGIGTALLRDLLERCAATGMREVIAVVGGDNPAASLALHRRCGFRPVGRLRGVGFKHGRWLDTRLLQRSLVDPGE